MPDQSIYERLDATQRELASIVEELGSAIYEAIERVTLNRVAIAAGLDHTVESVVNDTVYGLDGTYHLYGKG